MGQEGIEPKQGVAVITAVMRITTKQPKQIMNASEDGEDVDDVMLYFIPKQPKHITIVQSKS